MRRRITVAVIGVAVAAVLLAGLGTVVANRYRTRATVTGQLRREAAALVPFVVDGTADTASSGTGPDRGVVRRIAGARRALSLLDAAVVVVDAEGEVVGGGLPDGVDPSTVSAVTADTGVTSGVRGDRAWAAAASDAGPGGRRVVVVLTQQVPVVGGELVWVVVSGVLAVVLAVIAATVVARRLTRPLAGIGAATGRIAAGDLRARVGDAGSGGGPEIDTLARSIDAMAAALEQADGAQREFLLSISHDLRTPLTSIRGYAEAIVDGAAPDAHRAATVIVQESARMERLVADLLDLARLEAHRFTFDVARVDVVRTAQAAVAAFARRAADADRALDYRGDAEPVEVLADADRLAQVVANLIENALAFASHRVQVRVDRVGDRVRIAVVDDGPGIAADDLERVFDRGFSARPVPGRAGGRPVGSGLGLAIGRELVTAMGGTLEAHPAGDQGAPGTSMVVSLPVA